MYTRRIGSLWSTLVSGSVQAGADAIPVAAGAATAGTAGAAIAAANVGASALAKANAPKPGTVATAAPGNFLTRLGPGQVVAGLLAFTALAVVLGRR